MFTLESLNGKKSFGCATPSLIVICGSFTRETEMSALAEQLRNKQLGFEVTVPKRLDGEDFEDLLDKRFMYVNAITNANLMIFFAKKSGYFKYPIALIHDEWQLANLSENGLTTAAEIIVDNGIEFGEATSYEFAIAASLKKTMIIIPAAPDQYDATVSYPPTDWLENGFENTYTYNHVWGWRI